MLRTRTLHASVVAIGSVLAVFAVALFLSIATPAAAVGGWSIGPGVIHPDTSVSISGSKSPDSTVTVTHRPPGGGWQGVPCSGTGAGSTGWSCSLPPQRLGNHGVQVTETIGAESSTASGGFVVVPVAVTGPNPAPKPPAPPSPSPTSTPSPSATPTPTPTPTSSATATPKPPKPPVPTPNPAPTDTDTADPEVEEAEPEALGELPTHALPTSNQGSQTGSGHANVVAALDDRDDPATP